jgi:uncharacterized protein DUF4942
MFWMANVSDEGILMTLQTDVAKRETLTYMLGVYRQAIKDIETAYDQLEKAQGRLRSAFLDKPGYNFNTNDRNMHDRVGRKAAEQIIKSIKGDAWRVIVERMELRKLLSIKRRDELDRQLQDDANLPELTEENILSMFEQSAANMNTYLEEAVLEVFEYLRPPRSKLKTNTEFEIGRKVILSWVVEKGWNRGKYKVNYHREKYIVALQNVFQMLDGKGPVKEYYGELYGAITDSPDGTGETEYFKFRGYQNGNLHLEFRRLDLLARLNAIAGGNRLKTSPEEK